MTEEEAKTKWCSMVRAGHVMGMSLNREESGDFYQPTRCIASECMMWRWKKGSDRGYCGVAGNPYA